MINNIYPIIKNYGIIPEIKIKKQDKAVIAAKALSSGGLCIAEADFDPEITEKAVKEISAKVFDMLIIAGNIKTKKQAETAVNSGAKAVVLKGFDKEALSYCADVRIPVIPECEDENEIKTALSEGLKTVKFVLTDKTNKTKTIKKFRENYPEVQFILSGETVTENNLADYLALEQVIACGVPFIYGDENTDTQISEKIKENVKRVLYKMLGFEFSHVVINCENDEQAEQYSGKIESIFGFQKKDDGQSVSNADVLYFMKNRSYGRNGQISISTNFMERAASYLKKINQDLIEESARYGEGGELVSIYLDSIIGGFAFKLVKKTNRKESM